MQELKKCLNHPSADQLYIEVKKQLPHISLGTVYRNLKLLVKMGKIRQLIFTPDRKRYDYNIKPHNHFRCLACDSIEDIPVKVAIPTLNYNHPWFKKRVIKTGNYELSGFCPVCKKNMSLFKNY